MKKVVFYLKNSGVSEVDFSRPNLGNPGVGGTQFLFMMQPYYLQAHALKNGLDYEFILLTNEISKLPDEAIAYSVRSDEEAVEKANRLGADLFVFRPMEDDVSTGRTYLYANSTMKLLGWAHNAYSRDLLNTYSEMVAYKAHVCVCHEQLDALLDKRIYDKSTFVFNGFESEYAQPLPFEERSAMDVVYVGSMIPAKGFHMLAEAWPRVLERVPNARLKVIGSGKVYDRNATLGKYEIAQADYEARFMPYLTNSNGELIPSVEFLGLMGSEKFGVMKRAAVGVVNPTGMTENCPGSALEFQACGIPVVSAAKGGLWDTVEKGKTGVLVKNVTALSAALIHILENGKKRSYLGNNASAFVARKFDYEAVCRKWLELFEVVLSDAEVKSVRPYPKSQFWREKRAARYCFYWLRTLGLYGK
jgi:glycosyltransferase involved in cell wall biosynthesis